MQERYVGKCAVCGRDFNANFKRVICFPCSEEIDKEAMKRQHELKVKEEQYANQSTAHSPNNNV